jgi:hypothetical protein
MFGRENEVFPAIRDACENQFSKKNKPQDIDVIYYIPIL